MIESLMLCGIGLLAGCLFMLLFMSAIHRRAVRLTRQQLTNETPLTAKEIQAEKDQLRAQFAMSVRKLEIGMEEMRAKALDRSVDKQHAEIGRLQVELDKKTAMVLALRAREEVRRRTVRRIIKLLLYLFVRSKRRREAGAAAIRGAATSGLGVRARARCRRAGIDRGGHCRRQSETASGSLEPALSMIRKSGNRLPKIMLR